MDYLEPDIDRWRSDIRSADLSVDISCHSPCRCTCSSTSIQPCGQFGARNLSYRMPSLSCTWVKRSTWGWSAFLKSQHRHNMERREIWNLSENTSIPLGFYSVWQSAATANRMRFAIAAACHAGSIIFHSTNILQHIPLSSVILVKLFLRCIAPIRLLIYWAIVFFIWFNIETIASNTTPVHVPALIIALA